MESIGERIKLKRKELNLTQLELAKKLNVTDRAVSKWEQGEGNPDLTLIPEIAKILNVSLDYLIIGKEEPVISLDDMDETKRLKYLIKRNDVQNFIKYGYPSYIYIIDKRFNEKQTKIENAIISEMRNEIYDNFRIEIFSTCLNSFVQSEYGKPNGNIYRQMNMHETALKGILFYDRINEFLKMTAILGRVDVLEFIGLKYFAIGDRKQQQQDNYRQYSITDVKSTVLIDEKTIEYILTDKSVPENVKEYMSEPCFYHEKDKRMFFMNDIILNYLYKSGNKEKTQIYLDAMYKYLDSSAKQYRECEAGKSSCWYTTKFFSGDCMYFGNHYNNTQDFLIAVIPSIVKPIETALKLMDNEWFEKFNEYNKKRAQLLPELKGKYYTEKEVELMELEANPQTPTSAILIKKYVSNGIVDFNGLMNSFNGNCEKLEMLKNYLKEIKNLYSPIIKEFYIDEFEMILKNIESGNLKNLFKYSVDTENANLQEAVLSGDKTKIIEVGKSKLRYTKLNIKDSETIPTIKFYEDYKNDFVNNKIQEIENEIEKITHKKQLAIEYEKTMNDISENYLYGELEKGNEETVVIKLCVKLEAILKYKYAYEGDLFTMLDKYMSSNLNEIPMNNPWDDEDNDYDRLKKEDERNAILNQKRQSERSLLHKLRTVRNSYVHAEKSNVKLTSNELKQCIQIVSSNK